MIETKKMLTQYIENNNIEALNNYFDINDVNPNVINELIQYSIEYKNIKNITIETIDALINRRENKDVNFKIENDKVTKIPLLTAIEINDLKLADRLREKYKANVTYERKFIDSLLTKSTLNIAQLKYLNEKLNVKYDMNLITSYLQSNNNKLLKFVCSEIRFNTNFIIKLLLLYKKGKKNSKSEDASKIETCKSDDTSNIETCKSDDTSNIETCKSDDTSNIETCKSDDTSNIETCKSDDTSNIETCKSDDKSKEEIRRINEGFYEKFYNLIENDKKNFLATDELYRIAIQNKNFEGLRIIFEYDGSDESTIIKRIFNYDLLEKALILKENNYEWIESILRRGTFHCQTENYEKIFNLAKNNFDIFDLLMNYFYKNSLKITPNSSIKSIRNYIIITRLNFYIEFGWLSEIINYYLSNESLIDKYLNEKDLKGDYPLYIAIKCYYDSRKDDKYLKIINHLLENCSFFNIKIKKNISLLPYAVQNNYEEIVKILFSKFGNKDIKERYIIDSVTKAIVNNNDNITHLLLDYVTKHKFKFSIDDNYNLLNIAINQKKFNTVVPLILYMENQRIKFSVDGNYNLLNDAINQNNFNIVVRLILYMENQRIKFSVDENYNLLNNAINQKNFNIVVRLILYMENQRININSCDKTSNYTPLIHSYREGYMDIFKFLIEHLNINEVDTSGRNLLYYTVEKKDKETFDRLIKSGIDTDIIDNNDISIFDFVLYRNVKILKILFERDCIDLYKEDKDGNTPLFKMIKGLSYYRSLEDLVDLVDIIIKNGLDINRCNSKGDLPLHFAIKEGISNFTEVLIKHGAFNCKDGKGKYPMDYVLKESEIYLFNDSKKIRDILLNYGFDKRDH